MKKSTIKKHWKEKKKNGQKQTWITADQSAEGQKMKQVAWAVRTSPTNRTGSSHQKQPQHTPLSIILFIQQGQHVKSEAAELSTFALFNKPGWVDRTAGILLAGAGEEKKKQTKYGEGFGKMTLTKQVKSILCFSFRNLMLRYSTEETAEARRRVKCRCILQICEKAPGCIFT